MSEYSMKIEVRCGKVIGLEEIEDADAEVVWTSTRGSATSG